MEHTMKEIHSVIKNGPIEGKETVFLQLFDVILSCTLLEEAKQYFTQDFLRSALKFSHQPYKSILYKVLINIFSDDSLNERLMSCKNIMIETVNISLSDILDKDSEHSDSGCMLLSNITRNPINCELISNSFSSITDILENIVTAFTVIGYNSKCSLDQLAMIICNLSQINSVRSLLTKPESGTICKLIPFVNHESEVRRRGITGVIHNCVFDSSIHEWLLSDEVDILPHLLLPLAGPEQFDDEDNDKLPVDLQYLPDSKTRESNPEIRKELLESLNQLCATTFGRQFLRNHNAYIILRELHKWEEDAAALLACENVVDILIRTEEEIGHDQLKNIDIPSELEEKFNKELHC